MSKKIFIGPGIMTKSADIMLKYAILHAVETNDIVDQVLSDIPEKTPQTYSVSQFIPHKAHQ